MSGTKKCKSCQSEIDAKAKKCPQCQTDLRNWFVRHKILSGIGIIVIIGIIGSAASQSNKKSEPAPASTAASQNQPAATPDVPEITTVDAAAFIAEFDANKIAAQDKYKDKYVQLTGYVSNISGGDVGGIYLVIDPNQGEDAGYGVTVPYYGTNIQCHLLEKSDSSALANGQKATIKGQVDDMSLGIVQLKNCSLVK